MDYIENNENSVPASFTIGDCFITFGVGADVDNALDDATSSAWYELGRSHNEPSIVNIKPDTVKVLDLTPLPQDTARNKAYEVLENLTPGQCVAIKVASPGNYKKRKVLIKVEDTSFEIPDQIGKVYNLNGELLSNVEKISTKTTEELLGSIEIKRRKSKYKAIPLSIEPKKTNHWLLSEDLTKGYLKKFDTLKEAKREASILMKTSQKKEINIYQVTSKSETGYLFGYKNNLIKQTALLKLELFVKNEEVKEKTIGYIFVGRVSKSPVNISE